MIVILMGVSGSGKTLLGKLLASGLDWDFVDADEYHSAENRAKMRAGIPLTDADRIPWLEKLREVIQNYQKRGESLVLACSALRENYRKKLSVDQEQIRTIYLKGTREELAKRLANRDHEFFNPDLLDSQIAVLEEPNSGLTLLIDRSPQELVKEMRTWLQKRP